MKSKYKYNILGKIILEIRGRKGALARVRKECLGSGNHKKIPKIEKEMENLSKEYGFIIRKVNKIIEDGKVKQTKLFYCPQKNGAMIHDVCYHQLLGKCFIYHLYKKGELSGMKVDYSVQRQCPICEQMVFQSTDPKKKLYIRVKNKLVHTECANEVRKAYKTLRDLDETARN